MVVPRRHQVGAGWTDQGDGRGATKMGSPGPMSSPGNPDRRHPSAPDAPKPPTPSPPVDASGRVRPGGWGLGAGGWGVWGRGVATTVSLFPSPLAFAQGFPSLPGARTPAVRAALRDTLAATPAATPAAVGALPMRFTGVIVEPFSSNTVQ